MLNKYTASLDRRCDMVNIISDLIKNESRKSINYIEKLITRALKDSLELKKSKFKVLSYNNKEQILIEEGFKEYKGFTLIEVKLYQHLNGMYKFTEKELEDDGTNRIDTLIRATDDLKNIIYVVNSDDFLENKKIKSRIEKLKAKYNRINVDFIALDEIIEFTRDVNDNLRVDLLNLSNDIFKDEIKKAVISKSNWKSKREKLIEQVSRKYSDDGVVLFLGSGVSIEAGIPEWNKLITDMFVNLLESSLVDSEISLSDQEKAKIVEYFLKTNDGAPTLQAMYVKTMGKKNVHEADTSIDNKRYKEVLHSILYKHCVGHSVLLNEIVEFARAIRGDDKGLYAIVTYNFDDLLERNLKVKRVRYRSIYKDFDIPKKNELPIYHVHGFLPQQVAEMIGDISNGHFVFTQDEYHKMYYDYYHWANLRQLNFLKEKTCVFVGLSMSDPNLRRMLDLAKPIDEENIDCKHYAILKRDSFNITGGYGINMEHLKAFEVSNQRVKELYFEGVGVNVIWIENYEEIPEILKNISSS